MRPDAPGGGEEAPDVAPAGGAGDGPGDHRARGGADDGRGADGVDGGNFGLLARYGSWCWRRPGWRCSW